MEEYVNTRLRLAAIVGGLALLAAACGEAPEDDTAAPEEEEVEPEDEAAPEEEDAEEEEAPAEVDFLGCMVTDEGGVDDRSFNESAWDGLQNAQEAGTIGDARFVES